MSTDPTIFLALDVKHRRYSMVPTEKLQNDKHKL